MPDMQTSHDTRNIPIDKVGVKDISYPVVVMDKQKKFQHTVARINMYVDLPHQFKGTHMSRFVEILNTYREEIALDKLETILGEMKKKLGASTAHLEMEFPY
ncbi:MAG TPA: GTP cyclohydrolase, FolE2/MptA family, partial [Geobacteraceae bacterium]|nr:GTP cyclohydrolase, FolE2/MptA family [Geobacteraceae bacterium]